MESTTPFLASTLKILNFRVESGLKRSATDALILDVARVGSSNPRVINQQFSSSRNSTSSNRILVKDLSGNNSLKYLSDSFAACLASIVLLEDCVFFNSATTIYLTILRLKVWARLNPR